MAWSGLGLLINLDGETLSEGKEWGEETEVQTFPSILQAGYVRGCLRVSTTTSKSYFP